ncbi:hypothetical protein CGRA01v4_10597 [Colletotrichum graminicola]|nr:hypothetical protein CGRA01v4_10597 [Colletotrichum graminicola]
MIDHDYRESFDLSTAQLSINGDRHPTLDTPLSLACMHASGLERASTSPVCRFVDRTFAYLPLNRFPLNRFPLPLSPLMRRHKARHHQMRFPRPHYCSRLTRLWYIHYTLQYHGFGIVLPSRSNTSLLVSALDVINNIIPSIRLLFRHSSFSVVTYIQTNGQAFDQC